MTNSPCRYSIEPEVWKMQGTDRRETALFISVYSPERQGSWGSPSRSKGASRYHFPPFIPSINNGHLWEPVQHQHSLPSPYTHTYFSISTLLSHAHLSTGTAGPSPEDQLKPCQHHITWPLSILQDLSSSRSGGRSHFASRPLYLAVHNRQR